MSYHYLVFSHTEPHFFRALEQEMTSRGVSGFSHRQVGPRNTFRQYRVPDGELVKLHHVTDADGFKRPVLTVPGTTEFYWQLSTADLYAQQTVTDNWK